MGTTAAMKATPSILVGNAFPLTLVRRPVRIVPATREELHAAAQGKVVASFWGHANTLAAAEAFSGLQLAPRQERPAIHLQEEGRPTLGGETFRECWILSPDYAAGFRPAVGEEVPAELIAGWRILKMTWE